jgi:hypothetical protein
MSPDNREQMVDLTLFAFIEQPFVDRNNHKSIDRQELA